MHKRHKLPKEPIEITLHALSHDGRGIGTVDGKTVFVVGGLPGEVVSVKLLKRHSKYDEGIVIDVGKRSDSRVEPGCPHFTVCGGCRLQHMPESLQLSTKWDAVKELFRHVAKSEPEIWSPPLTGNQWEYRRKARLSVRHVPQKNRVLVGFRELNGRFVSDNRVCPILIPPLNQLLDSLSELIGSLTIPNDVPQIELAAGDDAVALLFRHLKPLTDKDLNLLKEWGKSNDIQIYLQPSGYDSLHMIEPEGETPRLHYKLDGIDFEFSPEQFVQVNAEINAKMLAQAIDWLNLKSNDRLLDLFCGIGNFSIPIAKYVAHVTGVEADETAVTQARLNAQRNDISNTHFVTANLFELPSEANWIEPSYNKLLLDPPRAGAEEVVMKINRFNFERIVYVSCHPATLARDSKILIDAGYRLEKAGIMDMFPHTQHVEAMALFKRC
jgi:23S rRNA (uracil1939-C5)-methyltransferase